MPNYHRPRIGGGTYFLTLVTHQRRPFLIDPSARAALRGALEAVQERFPFDLAAIVLLPDHLHTLWTLPAGDTAYSLRVQRVKRLFTDAYLTAGGNEGDRSPSWVSRQERGIWQRRFWEHAVRDNDDFGRCLDYLHYNAVKHRLVCRVCDYPWSSFAKWVSAGEYDRAWGTGSTPADVPGAEWE